jgi:glucose/mannose-6-phosphate isomerase
MHPLDDRSFVEHMDPSGMLRLTEEFPDQCRKALAVARSSHVPPFGGEPACVLLTGLGGSAAGGDLVKCLFDQEGRTSFFVNREYQLPSFVDARCLVFAVSYSGNTEETLAAYEDAKRKGARVVAVTTGGRLEERAAAHGDPVIKVPGGQPPRTALGYLFVPVLETTGPNSSPVRSTASSACCTGSARGRRRSRTGGRARSTRTRR